MFNLAIYWDPDPIIAQLGNFELRWYSLFFATGFIIGFFLIKKKFEVEKIDLALLDKMLLYSVIGTILGARIGNCLFYDFEYFSLHPLEIILPFQLEPSFKFTGFRGLASHGALLGLFIAYWLLSIQTKRSILWFFDKASVVAGICLASIRLGNFMNGEIGGIPTDLPWAFIFPAIDDIPRHPVQLYGFIVYTFLFLFMLSYYKNNYSENHQGKIFGMFLVLLGSIRILMEFLKQHYVFSEDNFLNMAQLLSIPMIIAGFVLLNYNKKPLAQS